MRKHHDVRDLKFVNGFLVLTIDGQTKKLELREVSQMLSDASDEEKNCYEISPSGYGIHWPLLDEDISIDGLLGIVHAPTWKETGLSTMRCPSGSL